VLDGVEKIWKKYFVTFDDLAEVLTDALVSALQREHAVELSGKQVPKQRFKDFIKKHVFPYMEKLVSRLTGPILHIKSAHFNAHGLVSALRVLTGAFSGRYHFVIKGWGTAEEIIEHTLKQMRCHGASALSAAQKAEVRDAIQDRVCSIHAHAQASGANLGINVVSVDVAVVLDEAGLRQLNSNPQQLRTLLANAAVMPYEAILALNQGRFADMRRLCNIGFLQSVIGRGAIPYMVRMEYWRRFANNFAPITYKMYGPTMAVWDIAALTAATSQIQKSIIVARTGPIVEAYIPPAEAEDQYYQQLPVQAEHACT
jgi:hypothetical protein